MPLFKVAYSFTILQLEAPFENENLLQLFLDWSFIWSSRSHLSRESRDNSAHIQDVPLPGPVLLTGNSWIYYKTNLKGRFCFHPFIYSCGHSGTKPLRNPSKITQLESGTFGIWTQMARFQSMKDHWPPEPPPEEGRCSGTHFFPHFSSLSLSSIKSAEHLFYDTFSTLPSWVICHFK